MPLKRLKRQNSGSTEMRAQYAEALPQLFELIRPFIIIEKMEDYNQLIRQEMANHPQLFNSTEIRARVIAAQQEEKRKRREEAEVKKQEAKQALRSRLKESVLPRFIYGHDSSVYNEPTGVTVVEDLTKYLQFEKELSNNLLWNKIFIGKCFLLLFKK